ncbi:MAG: hypothetical protein B6D41_00785 [Chloroflexi bacterium UTCFX4]|jgi:hypothetical protein|nr:MAG: hypothetical protein B6D41_00785 [Chloroflexi bacterium UTCFX4]
MNRIVKILLSALLGGWAGLVAWVILDLLVGRARLDTLLSGGITTAIYVSAAITGALVGLLAGMLISGLEKWNNSAKLSPTLVGAGIGIGAGLLGGMLGLLFAEAMFQNLPVQGDLAQISRVAGWALFGLGVGIAPGIATWSARKTAASSVGGFIGGILGGLALVALTTLIDFSLTGRAIGFVVLGACVGLFIALAQEIVKQAELKIISGGRFEGREFKIDKPRVTIGSSGRNDWVIADDPHLLPEHVEIRQEGGKFVLHSLNANAATAVNNLRVMTQPLKNGDHIQIGSTLLTITVR